MRKYIIHILMLLLSATAVLSCDVGMNHDMNMNGGAHTITVIGTASDIDTGKAIEEIKITLNASEEGNNPANKSAYTDNQGKYTISMSGFTKPAKFTITAEDPKGIYGSSTHEISLVKWDFTYSSEDGNFFVNGEDFYLKKAR